ncbi:CRM1 C terminal-domain-containing protein [Phlyctochytrium arcticum]|nr:CRM1 C terminal-domain-containing protein [Phlyctochytrium arcticum]
MEGILDYNSELDIALFDRVVSAMFMTGPEQIAANNVLEQFRQHPDAWKRVDAILENSQVMQSKYIALSILENLIKSMWKVLPAEQRTGIKNFIVAFIIKNSSEDDALERNRLLLGKLNIVLVQILKHEWPHNWPTFIPEIVNSSKTNLALCENNMNILKLLSEEIFDFSAEHMTSKKAKNLKNTMCAEFSEIFQLCHEVLEKAQKASLINATLETLLRFLNWIPLGYIFETNLITILQTRFLNVGTFRNVTLKCLTEIAGLRIGSEYGEKFVLLYNMVMGVIPTMLPPDTNIARAWDTTSDSDQQFIQNFALFLTNFLGVHLKLVEAAAAQHAPTKEALLLGHQYLLRISEVDDREVFKICLEYWAKLVEELFEEIQAAPHGVEMPLLNLSSTSSNRSNFGANLPLRKNIYAAVLTKLRVIMIEQMVKPEEVIVVENDEGEVVRESLKESDTIVLYKSMREVLVYLTHLDVEDMERIMSDKLARQMDGSEWSWANLNKLCWAIGSISGAMSEDVEKKFLVTVIKDLLGLTEMKRGKDNKAIVASNIMYIVGQYPRFLKAHWKFLKTVVNKLFEFMHELHEGVQEMACDTFIKIAQKCKRHFVIQQQQENRPYIDEILEIMATITSDLPPPQMHTFYEAVGYMISAQPNKQQQERLIGKFMEAANSAWDSKMIQARTNPEILNDADTVKLLSNIIKTNVYACTSVGSPFYVQVGRNFMDLLALYTAVSGLISDQIATQGLIATKTPKVRGLRAIKKDVLRLVDTYITAAEDIESVMQNMIPPLLETVLGDYARNVEPAKDAFVLNVMASIIKKLGDQMDDKIPAVLDAVFECTLNMINKNFEEYPEHRVSFFTLMGAINENCFKALLQLPAPQFRLFLDSIVWAFKHTMRDISDLGLNIILGMLNHFSLVDPHLANSFYQSYFLSLLQDIFFVLTNPFHKSGFKHQSMILKDMFALVESGQIGVPLFDPAVVTNPNMTNQQFVREFVMDLLQRAFPHLQANQISQVVEGLLKHSRDDAVFKSHLRDFLVTLQEFAGDDSSDLYIDEREAEAEMKKKLEMEKALSIPGMVKPSER